MKTYSIINLKGGVGKTISAINLAYNLTAGGKSVLLIDCDKQGNTSKFFGLYGYKGYSLTDVLTQKAFTTENAITPNVLQGLDVIPANMSLLRANREILMDMARPQQTRLSRALETMDVYTYDYCIIDCAPDINMATINALVASDAVLVPVLLDKFGLDGLGELIDQVEDLRDAFNPRLHMAGCFVTNMRRDGATAGGMEWLREHSPVHVFQTAIRSTVRVVETTYAGKPLSLYAPKSTAAKDYEALTREIFGNVSVSDTKKEAHHG